MNNDYEMKARDFIDNEKQFHLGFLPTEQSNPKTKELDSVFIKDSCTGLKMLFSVDMDIIPMAERIFAGTEFKKLQEAIFNAMHGGHRVIFSGCGATGRLSILLESMWRHFFIDLKKTDIEAYNKLAVYETNVMSIMTGGDFALVRSVESFEDYNEFGCQQVREMNIKAGDVLVGITEGGETSSVLGTVEEALERGADVFLMFNNPAQILCEHLERCRKVILNPLVTSLDLYCGSMAVTGSTRMQATSSELLIAGAALENCMQMLMNQSFNGNVPSHIRTDSIDWAAEFKSVIMDLSKPDALKAIASHIEFEEKLYRTGGLVTYYADGALLDIFTDTTERAPTFMLPPFRKSDDKASPHSWAFVKNPRYNTSGAWTACLGRSLRCLDWKREDYLRMGASQKILNNIPAIGSDEIVKFEIGNEIDLSRLSPQGNAAVMIATGREFLNSEISELTDAFKKLSKTYAESRTLIVGGRYPGDSFLHVPCRIARSPLWLMDRLMIKLVLNSISTGTMVRLGRVTGNWMSFVEVSNKKLVDRSTRLISELCSLGYERACFALFETLDELEKKANPTGIRISPVQRTITRLITNPVSQIFTSEPKP